MFNKERLWIFYDENLVLDGWGGVFCGFILCFDYFEFFYY